MYFFVNVSPPKPFDIVTSNFGGGGGGGGGQKVKIPLFRTWSKGMEDRAPCKDIFSPYTHHQPIGWIKVVPDSPAYVQKVTIF